MSSGLIYTWRRNARAAAEPDFIEVVVADAGKAAVADGSAVIGIELATARVSITALAPPVLVKAVDQPVHSMARAAYRRLPKAGEGVARSGRLVGKRTDRMERPACGVGKGSDASRQAAPAGNAAILADQSLSARDRGSHARRAAAAPA